jgi:hypothetical protein
LMRWVAWTELSAFPIVILETNCLLSREGSLKEHHNLTFSFYGSISLLTLATVDFPGPVWDATSLVGRSNPERTRILALIGVGTDFMV